LQGGDHIVNNKIRFPVLLAVLFTFVVSAGFPKISLSAEKTAGKKEVKKEAPQQKEKNNPYAKAKISTKIIPSINRTFGYEIILNGKTLVRQPSIPAIPGNDGFNTKEKAQIVANFVVKKVRNNEMPPTVTVEDLNKMGVLKKK
jgi:hypothetical protein